MRLLSGRAPQRFRSGAPRSCLDGRGLCPVQALALDASYRAFESERRLIEAARRFAELGDAALRFEGERVR